VTEADEGPIVRAAGGIVWRRDGAGAVEVLLVHRPRYDDWSFPKGKNDPGEDDEACAVREVLEETGVQGRLGPEVHRIRYVDHRGRPKDVRYWAMTVAGELPWVADDEVDDLAWLPLDEVRERLTYARDGIVLDRFLAIDL
jgi:8-oxo-dGTP diphosphatase